MIVVGEAQIISGAKLDFSIEWADALGGRSLSSASWATISGLTLVGASSISGTRTIARYTSTNVGSVYTPNVTAVLSTTEELLAGFRLQVISRIVVQDLARAVGAITILDALPWTDYLDGDTIASRSWAASGAGLTITSGGTTATPKITAVSAGTWYATEHIITTSGQEDERSIAIVVRGLT